MSKILLTFIESKNKISEDRELFSDSSDGIICYSFFEIPIRFSIDNIEILGTSKDPWCSIPILNFAAYGFFIIKKAINDGESVYEIPDMGDKVFFRRNGNIINVSSTFTNIIAETEICDLVNSFKDFIKNVQTIMITQVPEIRSSKFWFDWVNATDDEELLKPFL